MNKFFSRFLNGKKKKAQSEYLAEMLEPRILFSGSPAPDGNPEQQMTEPVQEAPVSPEAGSESAEAAAAGASQAPGTTIDAAQQAAAESAAAEAAEALAACPWGRPIFPPT